MAYRIELHRAAEKYLAGLSKDFRERITAAIDKLAEEPRPHGCKKLVAYKQPTWRVRVGRYRVLYRIYETELVVLVIDIDKRSDAYRE
jgi:mRNA interferase RelE/StbE